MPQNDFVPYATVAGANVISSAALAAHPARPGGMLAGEVDSALFNKLLRQPSTWAAVLGEFVVRQAGADALDDGNILGLLNSFTTGVSAIITSSALILDTSTTDGLIIGTRSPPLTAYTKGLTLQVQLARNIKGPTQINISGVGLVPVRRVGGGALSALDYLAGDILPMVFDGLSMVVLAPINLAYIDAPIIRTMHGVSPDFVDVNAFDAWLARRQITASGKVVVNVAAGRWNYPQGFKFAHPDASRVEWICAPLTGSQPVVSNLPFTGTGASARAADRDGALVAYRAVYATEFVLGAGQRGYIDGDIGRIQDLLITSPGGVANTDNLLLQNGTQKLTRVISIGATLRGICSALSYTFIEGICGGIGCGSAGVSAEQGSNVVVLQGATLIGTSSGQYGLSASGGATIACQDFSTSALFARGNLQVGVLGNLGSIVASSSSISRDNGSVGWQAVNTSSYNCNGCSVSGNPIGFQAGQLAYMDATNTSGPSTNVAYNGFMGGIVNRAGGTATGTNGVASPAVGSGPGADGGRVQ